jgi:putative transposase
MGYTAWMPWKETCVMNERTLLLGEYLSGDYSVSELARRRGLSRKSAYKWIQRYEELGWEGLTDRPRAPHHHPNAVCVEVEQQILEWKARQPLWGAPKIHAQFQGQAGGPSESTVSNILERHGLTRKVRRRSRATPSQAPLGHCERPNQVWSADFKGWFRTGDGRRCDPLTISDAHTRYLLRCQGLGGGTGTAAVRPLFIATFREYGMPEALRTDNGPPFASTGLAGLTELSVWWIRLGLRLERIRPGQPQENGRHERMHRTLKEAVARPPRSTLGAQQKAFDAFRHHYNEERPHEALGQIPPGRVYEPSTRDYPARLPEQRGYPDDWEKRHVRLGGQMRWKGSVVFLNHALWDQVVGLKPIDDGRWALYFEDVQLGELDERRRRVQRVKTLAPSQPEGASR